MGKSLLGILLALIALILVATTVSCTKKSPESLAKDDVTQYLATALSPDYMKLEKTYGKNLAECGSNMHAFYSTSGASAQILSVQTYIPDKVQVNVIVHASGFNYTDTFTYSPISGNYQLTRIDEVFLGKSIVYGR